MVRVPTALTFINTTNQNDPRPGMDLLLGTVSGSGLFLLQRFFQYHLRNCSAFYATLI